MGNTRNTGYLQNIVLYDANDNITLPARLAVTGTVAVNNTTPYDTTQFSLDVNGGLIVKNINKTAQFVLINSNPASGGNNAFVVHTVGGTSASSYADIQGYYGTSIAGSTVLRLNPQGGNVLVGSLAGTGSRMVVASATGVLSTQAIVTLGDLSGVSTTRTITINGTTQDLSADRTFTLYTDNISEDGSPVNLWFTNARARAAISVTGSGSYDSATGVITVTGGVTAVNTKTGDVTLTTSDITEGTRLYYTDTRVGTYLTSNNYATQTYVGTAIANLVDAAPGTLDTLNELAAALGDDPNFATSVATSIGTKEPVITAGTTTQYWRGDKTWQTLPIYTLSGLGGVPTTRTITINGTALDLSADRSFTINSMVYPGAGIAVSTGSAWGTSITDNSSNWNTAYGWGNHASAGYLTTSSAASTYLALGGGTMTGTLNFQQPVGLGFANGQYIKDNGSGGLIINSGAAVNINGTSVTINGSTAWHAGNLTNLNQLSNGPGYITGYTETDTLSSVVARGASTSTGITINPNGTSITMGGGGSAEGIRMQASTSTTYPAFLRSVNPAGGGETSAWLFKEDSTPWGIWHNNPINTFDFTSAGSGGIAQNVGGGTNQVMVRIDPGAGYVQTAAGFKNSAGTITLDNSGNISGNAATVSNGIYTTGSYANPAWITSLAYSKITGVPAFITSYTETDTLASVTGRGATTTAAITTGGLTVNTGGSGTWGQFVVNSTSLWGDGSTLYTTIGAGGAAGIMLYNPHVVWNSGNSCAGIRLGRSGGTSAGNYYEIGTGANNNFFIIKESLSAGTPQLNINSSGNATFSGTITASNFSGSSSGTNTGDQTNISGNAATAGSSNFLSLQSTSNLRTVTSAGIYREEQPDSGYFYTTTLNMNSSDGRQQLTIARGGDGMKFRGTTSGSGDVSWSSWKNVIHSDNIGSQSVNYASSAGTADSANNIDGWGFVNTGNNSATNADTIGSNGISYVATNVNLLGQTDGALYSQAYSSDWQHQIYGDYRTGQLVVRGKQAGSWTGWRTIIDSSTISSQPVVTIQDAAPSGSAGRLWWESDTGKLKVYYGSAWVDASPIPDTSLYYAKAGGPINGDVTVQQTLNVVGNTLVQGTISAFGDVIAYSSSDARLKDNITVIESPLEKVSKINGVSFNWNDKQSAYEVGKKDIGVIAQEVEEVLPELVTTRDNGYKAVRYEKIVALLIEAIKEQQTQINSLTDKLNNL